jgi:alcohol dehydrogenase (cytochrome c)
MIRSTLFATLLSVAVPAAALAQTAQDLNNDHKTTSDVLMYGMGYNAQRFSPLKQINRDTVKRLVPAWSYSLNDNRGDEAQALERDGVVYITDHSKTVAIDAVTGKQIWKSEIEYPPETTRVVCCGIVNRGGALYDGKLYRVTLDANVIALDQKTGKEVWRTKTADPKDGYSLTVAPLVANGVVIVGISGAEFGARGFLEGYDAQTGKQMWRTYTIPAQGEAGYDSWKNGSAHLGGGSGWITGSYDPQLDLVYWGIGNPSPWSPLDREGDNLYTNSMFAIKPKTGQVVWFYQMTPGDPFDYDGVNELVQADLKIDGKMRKVVMQANRNGFLYVVDRTNGKLITAHKFVKATWADGIDLKTGRPIISEATKAVWRGEKATIFPSATGGKNWMPMSFNPGTGLLYINTINIGWEYQAMPKGELANLKPGEPSGPGSLKTRVSVFEDPNVRGALKAIDPATGKVKWQLPGKSPNISGTLTTAGNVVFTGKLTGEFIAVDAETGKVLWQFQTPSGIVGQPVTFERNGKQYVTVTSGIGGVYAARSGDPNIVNVPAGGTLWTFKLFDEGPMQTSQR